MRTRDFLKLLFTAPVAAFAAGSSVPSLDNVDKAKSSPKEKAHALLTPTEIAKHWTYMPKDVVEINGKIYSCVLRPLPVEISTDVFDVHASKWVGNPMLVLTAKMCIIDAINKLGFTHVAHVRYFKAVPGTTARGDAPSLRIYAYGFFKKP